VVGLTTAFGSGAMTNSIAELEDADVLLVVGSNTTEQHPLIGRRILRAVRDKDRTLIVVDPRRIDLVEFARLHLQNYPGTDIAVINGLLHVILREGMEDVDFIQDRTEGFAELREMVMAYTPERVEEISGVSVDRLVEAAHLFGHAKRGAIVYAMGVTQHVSGTDTVLALANLAMATGNVGRRSTGVNPLRGQNNVQGACDMGCLPNVYPGYQDVEDPDVRAFFQKAWETDRLPATSGLTLCEMTDAILEGKIRWLFIMGENPVLSDPDSEHVRKALDKLDFLVVQDIFLSETAQMAHVVLPGASFAEKDGTFTSTERRVQRIRKAVEPLGMARSEWRVIGELARRMGYSRMNWKSPQEVFREIARVTPIYRGISYERLEGEGIQWPCPHETHPGTPFLHKEGFARGRGRFVPVEAVPLVEPPDEAYPMTLITGRILFHFHTGTLTRRSPTLNAQAEEAFVEINPRDAAILGVRQGQMVKLKSRRGSLRVKAHITDRIPQNMVFLPFHFAEAAANRLTLRQLDPKSKIPELKACAVRVDA